METKLSLLTISANKVRWFSALKKKPATAVKTQVNIQGMHRKIIFGFKTDRHPDPKHVCSYQ